MMGGWVDRDTWGAAAPNRTPRQLVLRDRPGVEVHHSVGLYAASSVEAWARAMQGDHLRRRNTSGGLLYADVWYSVGVWLDGTPIELRGVDYRSAPTDHLTVCLAGNYDQRRPTDGQWRTLGRLRGVVVERGGGDRLAWHGQRSAVGCPGLSVIRRLRTDPPAISYTRPRPQPDPTATIGETMMPVKIKGGGKTAYRVDHHRRQLVPFRRRWEADSWAGYTDWPGDAIELDADELERDGWTVLDTPAG